MAKGIGGGLPLACVLGDTEYSEVLQRGDHGTTFGGNPIACAGALAVLAKVAAPEFLADVKKKGSYIREKLLTMPCVKSVSGMGLMIGIELDCKSTAAELLKQCHEKGLMILTAKTKLRMLPPLNITYDELDEGLNILKSVLEAAK